MINSNKSLKRFYDLEFNKIRKAGKVVTETSKYFGEIGSTQIEDIHYSDQINVKTKSIYEIFDIEDLTITNPELNEILQNYQIVESPKIFEYRFRMDFVCDHNPFYEPHERMGQKKRKQFNFVVDMDECNLIPAEIFKKVREVYNYIKTLGIRNYDLVKGDGELKYLVVKGNDADNVMLNIITKTKDIESQMDSITKFAIDLGIKSINWIVNETVSDVSEGEVYKNYGEKNIKVNLNLNGKQKQFLVGANTFFQNNISCFEKILDYTNEVIDKYVHTANKPILFDLYSGVGTFGICFSEKFSEVIGFEINSESVELAKENVRINNLENITYSSANLNDTVFKLPAKNSDAQSFLIVDPPRAGLEKNGVEHVKNLNADIVIYVSCNPITQAMDLAKLKDYYKVIEMKGFDMFPHTYHLENVAILKRI